MADLIELPECARRTLETLYPLDALFGVPSGLKSNWDRMDFYAGLPWWTMGAVAITLPDPTSRNRFSVYLGEHTDFCEFGDMATLVHEVFHIYQYMSYRDGRGMGSLRLGFLKYLQKWVLNGYKKSPFENDAYDFQEQFVEALANNGDHLPTNPCNCASMSKKTNEHALKAITSLARTAPYRTPKDSPIKGFIAALLAVMIALTMWSLQLIFAALGMRDKGMSKCLPCVIARIIILAAMIYFASIRFF